MYLQVLRFFCIWDDRRSLFGDRRPYRLHYFLEDATLEVLETADNNNGRDAFPVFLRRGPLPKVCLFSKLCRRSSPMRACRGHVLTCLEALMTQLPASSAGLAAWLASSPAGGSSKEAEDELGKATT